MRSMLAVQPYVLVTMQQGDETSLLDTVTCGDMGEISICNKSISAGSVCLGHDATVSKRRHVVSSHTRKH